MKVTRLEVVLAVLLGATAGVAAAAPAPGGVTGGPDGTWARIPLPPASSGHVAIHDPARDRMLVFGGEDGSSFFAEVRSLSLSSEPVWSELSVSGSVPAGRSLFAAIYDPLRDRVLVFGGWDGSSILGDVWALSLSGVPAWDVLTPGGPGPSGRFGHTAVYDPLRDRMLVFGGSDGAANLDDVWELPLATNQWNPIDPGSSTPGVRQRHAAIYDPARDRMLIFGGSDGTFRHDTWSLELSGVPEWSEVDTSGTRPSPRASAGMVFDPALDRIVLFGGDDGGARSDVWTLSLRGTSAWTPLVPPGAAPPARGGHSMVYDPARHRILISGGANSPWFLTDTWALGLSPGDAWNEIAMPSLRRAHNAVLDAPRDRMLVFAGDDGITYLDDLWALSLGGVPAWSPLSAQGTLPARRVLHSSILDGARDRVLVFGGRGLDGHRNDLWELSLASPATWTALHPAGNAPPPRRGHSAVLDPARDRMIVFGGYGGYDPSFLLNDAWTLDVGGGGTWSPLVTVGMPPSPRYGHTAFYDTERDRMLVFGGLEYAGGWRYLSEVWELTLSGTPTWIPLEPSGDPPPGRLYHAAVLDSIRDRLVVFGGQSAQGPLGDTWSLALLPAPAWTELSPSGTAPAPRFAHSAVHDAERDRMITYGGWGGVNFGDVSLLEWSGIPVSVAPRPTPDFQLGMPHPNPAAGAMRVPFELSRDGRIDLDVFDLRGRRVRRIASGMWGPGPHSIIWNGAGADGRRLESGIYYIRLQQENRAASRKVVLLRPF